jgi:hypothetical protein
MKTTKAQQEMTRLERHNAAFDLQDLYHYSLLLAGSPDSTFDGERGYHSYADQVKLIAEMRKMSAKYGLELPKTGRLSKKALLSFGKACVALTVEFSAQIGIDPYTSHLVEGICSCGEKILSEGVKAKQGECWGCGTTVDLQPAPAPVPPAAPAQVEAPKSTEIAPAAPVAPAVDSAPAAAPAAPSAQPFPRMTREEYLSFFGAAVKAGRYSKKQIQLCEKQEDGSIVSSWEILLDGVLIAIRKIVSTPYQREFSAGIGYWQQQFDTIFPAHPLYEICK